MKVRWEGSLSHFGRWRHSMWKTTIPSHGPQVWPWWLLFSWRFSHIDVHPPSTGYRLWVYTRWGAVFVGVVFDRRKPQPPRVVC